MRPWGGGERGSLMVSGEKHFVGGERRGTRRFLNLAPFLLGACRTLNRSDRLLGNRFSSPEFMELQEPGR